MKNYIYYPDYVYNVSMDITRRNMAAYDKRRERITEKCYELAGSAQKYRDLSCIEQYKIYSQAADIIDGRVK